MMVDEGHAPGGEPHSGASAFQASLKLLDNRVDWIPMGWQGLYADMRLSLRAVGTAARADVVVYGAYDEDGLLYVDTASDDPVIRGVLRKARCRARCTCALCGRAGARPREFDECARTLCSGCAGIYLLYWELTSELAGRNESQAQGGTWQGRFGVRLWAAMRVAWPLSDNALDEETPLLNTAALKPWMERFWERLDRALD
jgi:hypothetical protein